MHENFLLTTPLAIKLYNEVAKPLPLIDFHNHLSVSELVSDHRFRNLAELWLLGDPYKHRAMRICGVPERYITGDGSDWEKFAAWCEIFPRLIGNALYDWSVMELDSVFGIQLDINRDSARTIWEQANQKLAEPGFSAWELLARFRVEYTAPCASLTDDLTQFTILPEVAPSLRGDDLLLPNVKLIEKLAALTEQRITSLQEYSKALALRLDGFHAVGCRFSDHALDNGFDYRSDDGQAEARFATLLKEGTVPAGDQTAFASDMLRLLSGEYAQRGWVMQLHIGAQRFTSTRLRGLAGATGGFAGIGNVGDVRWLTSLLDDMEQQDKGMPRVLLFSLNPTESAKLAVLSGSYSEDGISAKVSHGPAWWWCDHLLGMREMLDIMSSYSVLSTFIGMTTDSRTLLSNIRHEYFRRVLCGWLGERAQRGEIPDSFELLKDLVESICYKNVKQILNGRDA